MSLKFGENVLQVSNSLDPGEAPSYSVSHSDPTCLHKIMALMVFIGGLRANLE